MLKVKRLERGWAGHFICSDRCRFRRNTLLDNGETKVVVSTVGLMESIWPKGHEFYKGEFAIIGIDRYYETMAFFAANDKYFDADVGKQIYFKSEWAINKIDADIEANQMHENVVDELTSKLQNGTLSDEN